MTDTTIDSSNIDYQTDQYLTRRYVSRILTRFFRYRDDYRWTLVSGEVFGSPLLDLPKALTRRCRELWHNGVEREDVPHLRQLFQLLAGELDRTPCPEGTLRKNLQALATELKLPDASLEVLTFLLAVRWYEPVKALVEDRDLTPSERTLLIAAATGLDPEVTLALLSEGSPLIAAGLVEPSFDSWSFRRAFTDSPIPSALLDALNSPHPESEDVLSWAVLGDRRPALPLEAFAHLKPWPEVARRCLKAADVRGLGLNVLLHGPGGAGKTALARSLATGARLALFTPADADRGRAYCTDAISLSLAILRQHGHSALLMDPGFLTPEHRPAGGQLELLRLLGHPGVQVLWTAPSPDALPPDLLHRFDLAIALPAPPEPWTRPIWEDLLTPDERATLGII